MEKESIEERLETIYKNIEEYSEETLNKKLKSLSRESRVLAGYEYLDSNYTFSGEVGENFVKVVIKKEDKVEESKMPDELRSAVSIVRNIHDAFKEEEKETKAEKIRNALDKIRN